MSTCRHSCLLVKPLFMGFLEERIVAVLYWSYDVAMKKSDLSCLCRPDCLLVVCGFLFRDGAVLVARRSQGQRAQGLWEFPGGKVEDDEALGVALEREWLEEFGLVVQAGEICSEVVVGHIQLVALRLTCPAWQEPRLLVHDAWQWCALSELGSLAFPAPDLLLVAWLQEHGQGAV